MRPLHALTLAIAALVVLPAGLSVHPQPLPSGGSVTFQLKAGGNEWWVEAIVRSTAPVSKVEVMDDGGPWAPMTYKPEWGSYALSYHVEPGHRVTFRATTSAGVVTSCPFTHPAGAEQCATSGWTSRKMLDLGTYGGDDIAVGDGDNDGRQEVYLPTSTGIQQVRWTSTGWTRTIFGQDRPYHGHIAVGDANNDGRQEVWTLAMDRVIMHEWSGSAWAKRVDHQMPGLSLAALTVGDIDDNGRRELYFGHYGQDTGIYMLTVEGYTPSVRKLATVYGSAASVWVGDGDGTGDLELALATEYKGTGNYYLVDVSAVTGIVTVETVADAPSAEAVVAGDGDSDGKGEVYGVQGYDQILTVSRKSAAGWQTQTAASLPGWPADLALGDGDNEGRQEFYITASPITGAGRLLQVKWAGSGWALNDLVAVGGGQAMALAVGDADNDGKREVYALAHATPDCCENGAVYRVANHPPPPLGGGFDATFTGVRGNEWWVQAFVSASGGTLFGVDVRLNGGSWIPLAKQSWGGWAKSIHIVQGTTVQLRATSTTGGTDLSECYRWIPPANTDATKVACPGTNPPPPPPPAAFDATFSGVKGNDWWVQVSVSANQPVTEVVARVDCSVHWRPLVKQSWGGWAASFQVPRGAKVDFQARNATYASDVSGGYIWPDATPAAGCPQGDWPRQGSFAVYGLSNGVCGGGNCFSTSATFRTVYDKGRWMGGCVGQDRATYSDGRTETHDWTSDNPGLGPVTLPPATHVGAEHLPTMIHADSTGCSQGRTHTTVTVRGQQDKQTAMRDANGQPVVLRTWFAESTAWESNFLTANWETKVGLIVELESTPRMSQQGSESMDLLDTDAPIR